MSLPVILPCDFHTLRFLYALGNTPPKCLTQGQATGAHQHEAPPLTCLLLGCGDMRHIMFTAFSAQQQAQAQAKHHAESNSSSKVTSAAASASSADASSAASASVSASLLSARRLDVTLCDIEPAIHARNIMLLCSACRLMQQQQHQHQHQLSDADDAALWSLYNDHFITRHTAAVIQQTLTELISVFDDGAQSGAADKAASSASTCVCGAACESAASSSCDLCRWHVSASGRQLRFCDSRSLQRVLIVWRAYHASLKKQLDADDATQRSFLASKTAERRAFLTRCRRWSSGAADAESEDEGEGIVLDLTQSSAPATMYLWLHVQAMSEPNATYTRHGYFARDGVDVQKEQRERSLVNPLFFIISETENDCSVPSTSERYVVHYGLNPLAAYSLADTLITFHTDTSRAQRSDPLPQRLVRSARRQFAQWTEALVQMMRAERIIMRMVAGDALDVCSALTRQADAASTGDAAELPMSMGDLQPLRLHGDHSSRQESAASASASASLSTRSASAIAAAPRRFDVIDTSNLSDHIGLLTLLLAAEPLLSTQPGAQLHTDTLVSRHSGARNELLMTYSLIDPLLCAPLIGVAPVSMMQSFAYQSPMDSIVAQADAELRHAQQSGQTPAAFTWMRAHPAPPAGAESDSQLTPAIPITRTLGDDAPGFQCRVRSEDVMRLILSLHHIICPPMMEKMRLLQQDPAAALRRLAQLRHYTEHLYIALLRHMQHRRGVQLSDGASWSDLHERVVPTLGACSGDLVISNKMQSLWLAQHLSGQHSTMALTTDPIVAAEMAMESCGAVRPRASRFVASLIGQPPVVRVVHLIPWHTHADVRFLKQRNGAVELLARVRKLGSDDHFADIHSCYVRVVHRKKTGAGAAPLFFPEVLPPSLGCWRHASPSCARCVVWHCDAFALESTTPSDPSAMWCVSFLVPTFLLAQADAASTRISIGLSSDGGGSTDDDIVDRFGDELDISVATLADTSTTSLSWQLPRTWRSMREDAAGDVMSSVFSQPPPSPASLAPPSSSNPPVQLMLSDPSAGPVRLTALQCMLMPSGALADAVKQGSAVSVEQHTSSSLTLRFGSVSACAFAGDHRHVFFPLAVDVSGARMQTSLQDGSVKVAAPLLALALQRTDRWTSKTQIVPMNPFTLICSADGSLVAPGAPSLPLPLDQLPLLDHRAHDDWLNPLFGSMLALHAAEKAAVVAETQPAFTSLKESLHAMCMHALGRAGEQAALMEAIVPKSVAATLPLKVFGLNCRARGGVKVLVLLHGMRLVESLRSVVLDCSVCLLETENMHNLLTRNVGPTIIDIFVTTEELELWKYYLPLACHLPAAPSMVHKSSCEYARSSARIPLAVGHGARPYCQCHRGVGLPAELTSSRSPLRAVAKYFTRAAFLPMFPPAHARLRDEVPYSESPRNNSASASSVSSSSSSVSARASVPSTSAAAASASSAAGACAVCGVTGVPLKRCSACRAVSYCGVVHQRQHWSQHKDDCKAAATRK